MVYNLEYELLDSIGRGKKKFHHGIFGSLDELEDAKKYLLSKNGEKIKFNVYVIEDLFSRIAQA